MFDFVVVVVVALFVVSVRSVWQDQLRLLHMEQRGIGARDPTAAAQLADSEAAIMTRIAEKKLQMMVRFSDLEWKTTKN